MNTSIPGNYVATHPTGSKFTCDPPVLTTDEDHLVLVNSLSKYSDYLIAIGYEPCTDEEYETDVFHAFRAGSLNLIVTDDRGWYARALAATLLAKQLNLQTKDERVALFACVREGADYTGRVS